MDCVLVGLHGLSLEEDRQEFEPIQVEKDLSVVKNLFRLSPKSDEWYDVDFDTIFNYSELDSQSQEYKTLEGDFRKWFSYSSCYRVRKIIKVQNPFLYVQYQLKLKQKAQLYGIGRTEECQLYHGTKRCNIDSICRRNFDWRKLGANGMRSSKFGRGVSFSPSAKYAADYPRRYPENPRTMIVANVIEGLRCNGFSDMEIPPMPADTSVKPGDGHVVVKYFDNEFYPEFVIYYS